jgi:hypothetical protein
LRIHYFITYLLKVKNNNKIIAKFLLNFGKFFKRKKIDFKIKISNFFIFIFLILLIYFSLDFLLVLTLLLTLAMLLNTMKIIN